MFRIQKRNHFGVHLEMYYPSLHVKIWGHFNSIHFKTGFCKQASSWKVCETKFNRIDF